MIWCSTFESTGSFPASTTENIHEFDHDEARLTSYVESQGQTREEFDAQLRSTAETAVKTQLLLDEIAEKNAVEVGQQELMERIFMQAQRFGISPEEYIQQAQQANQLGAIFADVRRGKALATVVRSATIVGPDGEPIDLSDLFGTEGEDEGAALAEALGIGAPDADGADDAAPAVVEEADADAPAVDTAAGRV